MYYEVEDVGASHEDEELMLSISFDEVIQVFDIPAQEEVNTVSCFPFQDFEDALFCDLESEELLEDPLDVLSPSCYDIDEFIHVGKHKWDVIGYDGDPIYDFEGHFHLFPSQTSYEIVIDSDIWQQGDGIVTNIFQTPKDDLVQCYPDDFQSYLEDFDDYSFEHSDLFYQEYYQPSLCSDLGRHEDVVFLKQDSCDKVVQLPLITLHHSLIKDAVGEHVSCTKFSPGQSLLLEFKGRLNSLRRRLLSQSFNFPLRSCQSLSRSLLVPSHTLGNDEAQGSQPSESLIHHHEPLNFHDPLHKRIGNFSRDMTWHDFVPPSCLHELDFRIPNGTTHVIFLLNLSFLWFMMKHIGRDYKVLLGWFHWLFDYT
jgi:hypothetical protein